METRRVWNERDFITASRVWKRGETMGTDDRRALERAAVRYFWKACGIERRGADQPINAPRPRADTQRD